MHESISVKNITKYFKMQDAISQSPKWHLEITYFIQMKQDI